MTQRFESPYPIDYSQRDPAEAVDDLFYQRWSPRAFKPIEIDQTTLTAIFDAARWTQSSYNEQPWVFITASIQNTESFATFVQLLVEENQVWAKNASVLGFVLSRRHSSRTNKENASAKFDCGSAWMAMTLQARLLGLYTHGMGGILRDEVYQKLNIEKEKYEVICGFAIGALDSQETLAPPIRLEEKPSARKPLKEIWRQYK